MSGSANTAADVCYRHPNRQSFVLCQRCGRTICADCQTPAAVGFHCPECMKESRQTAPKTKSAVVVALRPGSSAPVVTWTIIVVCVVVYIAQILSNGPLTAALFYAPALTEWQPWRMLTALFVHDPSNFLHPLLNLLSLYFIGPPLELALGRWRFLALYLLSGFGGSVAVLLLAPTTGVVGASGAIFGLLGAFFLIQRRLGGNSVQIIFVIGVNLLLGFIIPRIAWEAHIGGLVVGGIVGLVFLRTRPAAKRKEQLLLLFFVLVGLVVLTVIGVGLLQSRIA
jgi:membrane associated rhomboid family serine protease